MRTVGVPYCKSDQGKTAWEADMGTVEKEEKGGKRTKEDQTLLDHGNTLLGIEKS